MWHMCALSVCQRQEAPDIIAEVASPSQSRGDLEAKARAWLDGGALLVWLIWPDSQRVDVWRSVGTDEARQPQHIATLALGDALDGPDILPGFTYLLTDLFA